MKQSASWCSFYFSPIVLIRQTKSNVSRLSKLHSKVKTGFRALNLKTLSNGWANSQQAGGVRVRIHHAAAISLVVNCIKFTTLFKHSDCVAYVTVCCSRPQQRFYQREQALVFGVFVTRLASITAKPAPNVDPVSRLARKVFLQVVDNKSAG